MRKLATIRRINEIRSIPDADSIECAVVGGWTVVVKKGDFASDRLACFVEVDAWVPNNLAPYLSKGKEPNVFEGVKGERLRSVRLRGQLSQGLLLPLNEGNTLHNNDNFIEVNESQDVSEFLGIIKWEAPIPAQLSGQVRGLFPSSIRKTDQERIQNLSDKLPDWQDRDYIWEVTEKLDGTSMTVFLERDGRFGVCGRNWELTETVENSLWRAARKTNLEFAMRETGRAIAIQGELVGEGIQGNPYKLKGQHFYVYDIYDIADTQYLTALERVQLVKQFRIEHVPVIGLGTLELNSTASSLLLHAEGKSEICSTTEREGLVYKCIQDPGISFKAISNKFLLKTGG